MSFRTDLSTLWAQTFLPIDSTIIRWLANSTSGLSLGVSCAQNHIGICTFSQMYILLHTWLICSLSSSCELNPPGTFSPLTWLEQSLSWHVRSLSYRTLLFFCSPGPELHSCGKLSEVARIVYPCQHCYFETVSPENLFVISHLDFHGWQAWHTLCTFISCDELLAINYHHASVRFFRWTSSIWPSIPWEAK